MLNIILPINFFNRNEWNPVEIIREFFRELRTQVEAWYYLRVFNKRHPIAQMQRIKAGFMSSSLGRIFNMRIARVGFLVIILLFTLGLYDAQRQLGLSVTLEHSQNYAQRMNSGPDTIIQAESFAPTENSGSNQEVPRSHAPEPSSIFMIISGIGAAITRFAQRSFRKFKKLFDIFVASIGLILSIPIVVILAILVKLTSKGPAIYKQARVGKDGEIFNIYKLRTMFIDSETNTGAVWAKEGDPRITKLGRFMRKTHLDEIPQLINVLKGQMSIIVPRPERPEIVKDLKKQIPEYEKRLKIKPGITGLAQVFHKYDESIKDVKKKIKYDLLYIRKMCLLVDLRIILQTIIVVFTGKGAR